MRVLRPALLSAAAFAALSACGPSGPEILVAAGSENKPLEPLVREFCDNRGARCAFDYKGSLDIGFEIKAGTSKADVVWPAASIWVDLFDVNRKVKHLASISQTPVLLGVRKSKAEALGWTNKDVTSGDVVDAVRKGDLKFLMSSATQSNSGAGAYLAMLTTAAGRGDLLSEADLANQGVRDQARTVLGGVERSSGSSGWLGELFLDQDAKGQKYQAIWNYEAVLKETNDALVARKSEPLWIVYPKDGVAIADGPLGYLDRGRGKEAEDFVLDLQKFLLAPEQQAKIAATGRRVGLGRAEASNPVPDWNFDPKRQVTAVRPPEAKTIWAALNLYQEALRRPSLTALCLDVSGSMDGQGIRQLHQATRFLFSPEQTKPLLIQWTPGDRVVAIPFESEAGAAQRATGADADQAKLRAWGQNLRAGGGTDMYACASAALDAIRPDLDKGYLPAILIMTDGVSDGDFRGFMARWRASGHRVPVFGVTFGDADRSQLDRISAETGGRVFDGRSNLVDAFRAARGYN